MSIYKKIRKKLKLKTFFVSLLKVDPYSCVFGFDRGTPIDRLYIESFLNEHEIDIQGNILEVAESTYSKKFGHHVKSFQILHFEDSCMDATLIGDLSIPDSLPSHICNCFICTQTLNFVYDVKSAIVGCYKLLEDDGVFLGTVAGLSQISRYDMDRWGDYWRFTDLSIKKMFEEVFGIGNVEVQLFGNALAATAFIQGLALEEIHSVSNLMITDHNYQIIIGIRAIKRKV